MPGSPPSTMISKWSSKSPKQKATRIRNNQRRHRAKVKTHISTLEAELAESQRQLIAAEHRITALTVEVERLLKEAKTEPALASVSPVQHSFSSPMLPTVFEAPCCCPWNSQRQLSNSLSSKQNTLPFDMPVIPNSMLIDNISAHSGINTGNGMERDGLTLAVDFVAQYDCQSLPPPRPGESTTDCVAAYRIIEQQNFKGVEMEAIHQRLQSGYRRAKRHGDGCTVVNSLLYSIIGYLSPV
ncbi:hypothetical protein CFAM422_010118 [Trichoderma lentiforme]|uniref:BZIP domain-containing protein n=1 Tax=Trichoderma lentiforme TaxID=1567552 RepID=A0A9P4X8H3_9HYPO|nr:hypothetical protein CFAM422_010118 [Trichoderma lentiforme]